MASQREWPVPAALLDRSAFAGGTVAGTGAGLLAGFRRDRRSARCLIPAHTKSSPSKSCAARLVILASSTEGQQMAYRPKISRQIIADAMRHFSEVRHRRTDDRSRRIALKKSGVAGAGLC